MSACRSCGAAVVWVRTEAGHAMPPIEAAIQKGAGGLLYVSHFATCPHAATHRKKGKKP